MALNFYTSPAKGFKRYQKLLGLIPAFIEVTGGKTGNGGLFATLNRVK